MDDKPELDPRRERAAQLLSLGTFTATNIAERLNISLTTLNVWQKEPLFRERVKEIRELDFEFFKVDRELYIMKMFEAFEVAKKKKDVAGMQTSVLQAAKLSGHYEGDTVNHKHVISTDFGTTDDWSNRYVKYDEKEPMKVIEAKPVGEKSSKSVPPWRKENA